MSIARAGYVPHNKGVPCSEETKAKISATKQLKARNERL
jgi:hypothetical protein